MIMRSKALERGPTLSSREETRIKEPKALDMTQLLSPNQNHPCSRNASYRRMPYLMELLGAKYSRSATPPGAIQIVAMQYSTVASDD
jgi:hypothetical protein